MCRHISQKLFRTGNYSDIEIIGDDITIKLHIHILNEYFTIFDGTNNWSNVNSGKQTLVLKGLYTDRAIKNVFYNIYSSNFMIHVDDDSDDNSDDDSDENDEEVNEYDKPFINLYDKQNVYDTMNFIIENVLLLEYLGPKHLIQFGHIINQINNIIPEDIIVIRDLDNIKSSLNEIKNATTKSSTFVEACRLLFSKNKIDIKLSTYDEDDNYDSDDDEDDTYVYLSGTRYDIKDSTDYDLLIEKIKDLIDEQDKIWFNNDNNKIFEYYQLPETFIHIIIPWTRTLYENKVEHKTSKSVKPEKTSEFYSCDNDNINFDVDQFIYKILIHLERVTDENDITELEKCIKYYNLFNYRENDIEVNNTAHIINVKSKIMKNYSKLYKLLRKN
jgi:hypothetical protein